MKLFLAASLIALASTGVAKADDGDPASTRTPSHASAAHSGRHHDFSYSGSFS
jgi:hypothetical protein